MPRTRTARHVVALVVVVSTIAAPAGAEPAHEAVRRLASAGGGPSPDALDAALSAYDRAVRERKVARPGLLTLIDYTLPSTEPRLWVIDLESDAIRRSELVAHGKGSGDNLSTTFSNAEGSHKSSLGLFLTADTYTGRHGYSLRLHGLDPGVNDRAYARAIVIHGAWYVSPEIASRQGRLGRSWGCPAVAPEVAGPLIDLIKGGTVLYVHGPRPRPSRP
jgi:hypothetical protein